MWNISIDVHFEAKAATDKRLRKWGRLDSNQRPTDYENDSGLSSDQAKPSQLRFDLG